MSFPRRTCAAFKIIDAIAEHGPLTIEEGTEIHKQLGNYPAITRKVYDRALKSGWLVKRGEKYSISSWIAKWHADLSPIAIDKLNIVPPRVVSVWTPEMDGRKYVNWMRSGFDRRGEDINGRIQSLFKPAGGSGESFGQVRHSSLGDFSTGARKNGIHDSHSGVDRQGDGRPVEGRNAAGGREGPGGRSIPAGSAMNGRELRDLNLDLFELRDAEFLSECRNLAKRVAMERGQVSINDIRERVELPANLNPSVFGAVFKTRDFKPVGYTEAKHKSAHARAVRVYSLA